MILRPRPHGWQLLYIIRGSILPAIAPKVLAIVLLSVAVCAFAEAYHPFAASALSIAPFSLFGLVLSIFLSFRNNACHDRWWEARKLWGQLIVESRTLARQCQVFWPDDATLRRRLVYLAIGFSATLAAKLRGRDTRQAAHPWLQADDAARLGERLNVPDQLLGLMGDALGQARRAGSIDSIQYGLIEARVTAMTGIQAACERIASTPLPFAYTLLLHRGAWIFCVMLPFGLAGSLGWFTPLVSAVLAYAFFGLDHLGDELEEPFGLAPNDLPLDALVRGIEIDLRDALGERPLPEPLQPRDYVLQ
ncbi:bestrophin family ion channel [Stenotrophomonas sp. HITSZ_GD]|uniref:bestrophin family protein n=1 Tax=Stenotrophomonas sp. HITSZ_GD TaxID=3037248 RepID=UPI00240E1C64|nr:bestrophin family ion channel [Stenotrophomonas sp. HITSZ_GD]MDG2525294.1 bestrophin family ion channel [Stenotrophomonas sp. HITSZ_GD]